MATCWPVLRDACCCCKLETCCKVQGWLALAATPFALGLGGVLLSEASSYTDETSSAFIGMGAFLIVYFTLLATIDILFLIGISKRRPSFMWPYVIYLHVGFVVNVIYGIIECTVDVGAGIPFLLIGCGLQLYMLLCANSLLVTFKLETSNTV